MGKAGSHIRRRRGLTATAGTLLVIAIAGTQCAVSYTGTLNSYLGTSTSKIVQPENSSADTEYYKSEYGEKNAENLQKLIADTYAESVLEEEEGAVLLRNEKDALPLEKGLHVTLFGHAVVQPVYGPGGANSSAAGSADITVDLKEALEQAGYEVNSTLYDAYASSKTARVASNNLQVAGGPNSTGDFSPQPVLGEESASFYTDTLKDSWADDYQDAAIVMLAREGGEDKEMMMTDPEGISALALHQDEKDLLDMIRSSGKFKKVIVLLNSAYPMEVEWLGDYDVDACLWIGNPGIRGFEGVVNLLDGDASPSGKLADTYAADSLSSPAVHTGSQSAKDWSNIDDILANGVVTDDPNNIRHVVVQQEGIYVGYKYYETRYEDSILNPDSGAESEAGSSFGGSWNYAEEVSYPFGYGLSYTTFEQELENVAYDAETDTYEIDVKVSNTGDTAGRSVVEVYAQTPYGSYEKENLIEKSAVQLAGYGTTKVLEPGESEEVKVSVDRYLLASYDYKLAKGYVMSEGDYYFAVGDDAHEALNNILAAKGAENLTDPDGNKVKGDAAKTYTWTEDQLDTDTYRYSENGTEVTNQFDDADLNYWQPDSVTYMTRQDWEGTFPEESLSVECTPEMEAVLQGDIYQKADDAPSVSSFTQGENSGLTLAAMHDVEFDDDETWNKYLNQMTIEEMASQVSDMFGTTQVESVGKPNFTDGDGTASIGDNTYPEKYGDTRNVCLYPSSVVAASMWDQERLARRGQLMGEEALYCELPEVFTGGGNLHRTPFGGRNGEYYSEDPVMCMLDAMVQLPEMAEKGVQPGLKHLAGNDQELYREGLNLFFTEQSFRETSLRIYEGVLKSGKVHTLMQSFNRLGLVWSSSSRALCTQVVRNEWGFQGQEESDGVIGGAYKYHFASSLAAGTTTYCIDPQKDGMKGVLAAINDNNDGYLLQCLRTAIKNYHYMLSRSNLINGMSEDSTIVRVYPWWQKALYALDGVLAGLTVLALILYVRSRKKESTVQVISESSES